ncbi:hypothetical protein AVEN_176741-1 [Araneus ventricosus]|uniref:Uncharacterized protein n=1 Tax=Araneus ventricosus TaxID=182803 RepID=A0A4Y2S424_ARAVE|nr:hypothetical protein AVEN_176741-1 [Araneus ventricosus]
MRPGFLRRTAEKEMIVRVYEKDEGRNFLLFSQGICRKQSRILKAINCFVRAFGFERGFMRGEPEECISHTCDALRVVFRSERTRVSLCA